MKIFFFLPLLSVLLSGCLPKNGPCEYDITEIQAKIISIEPYKNKADSTQLYHIILRFNESNLAKQDQFLEDWVPRIKGKTGASFLENNNITVGDIYPGTVSEKKSGNCQPVYVSFNNYFKTD